MKNLTYEQARNYIEDGDVLFMRKGNSFWSKLIRLVTGSDVYHCGIAFWVRDPVYKSRLFVVEAHAGGRRIVSLSTYANQPMDVLASTVPWEQYCDDLLSNTGRVPYSLLEFLWIGAIELFGIRRHTDDLGEVCSKMVALHFQRAGLDLETDVSPGRLREILLNLNFQHKFSIIADDTVNQPTT